ncbi:multiple organellar RNA editing factor 8, chloroplastic/mitochondrial-like isoform X2 [Telopea speciosissima]|uniref:multiple organellar RNA editing factor 8, chloroplastic/mitochondrial-like isoform X2 n=1 Tax=Telopea speciosissima TaxID=54955 RepID=UPI001CC38EC9|nr:multiple organellar RNA editing factor 8, chloroplastic/mitochondrial-like isoform X2 [Telopea speciosissima]
MAVASLCRTLISKPSVAAIFSRSFTSSSISVPSLALTSRYSSPLLRIRPLVTALTEFHRFLPVGLRCFATRQTASSLNDPNPNWSNRPPKETILLDGCDFEHWLIVMEKPEGEPTRDEIIDSYIKTLATVVGSEDEARMKIYSVSTRHYFAFGALVSEELSYKLKEVPRVRWVLPDSYLDVRNKDYGGEPFINGQAVPYDPKYHEEWVRNNARANERSRRNDRPRNFDRSRNFERRRENMQNRDFQNREPNQMPNMGGAPPNQMPNMGGAPPNQMPNMGGAPPNQMPNMGGAPPNPMYNRGGPSPNPMPNMGGVPPNPNPMQNMGGPPSNPMPNMGGMQSVQNQMPRDAGPGAGFPNMHNRETGGMPQRDFQNRDAARSEGMPYQSRDMPTGSMPNRDYQGNYTPNRDMESTPSGNPYQVRDMPGRDYQ